MNGITIFTASFMQCTTKGIAVHYNPYSRQILLLYSTSSTIINIIIIIITLLIIIIITERIPSE